MFFSVSGLSYIAHFLTGLIVFLLSYLDSLHNLYINSVIFSHFVTCLFTLLSVFFAAQGHLSWMQCHLFFALIACAAEITVKKPHLCQCPAGFLARFPAVIWFYQVIGLAPWSTVNWFVVHWLLFHNYAYRDLIFLTPFL